MVLFNDRNTAASTCDDDLSGVGKSTDGIDFHNTDRLGSRNDTAEALSGNLPDIVPLFYFNFSIVLGHVATD